MTIEECIHLFEDYNDNFICKKQNKILTNEELDFCEYDSCDLFEYMRSCYNCKHCNAIVYETGTIDDIAYHCKLQRNKLIYDDISPYRTHWSDFPPCNINHFDDFCE